MRGRRPSEEEALLCEASHQNPAEGLPPGLYGKLFSFSFNSLKLCLINSNACFSPPRRGHSP